MATKLRTIQGNVRMTVVLDTIHSTVPNFVYMEPEVIERFLCK